MLDFTEIVDSFSALVRDIEKDLLNLATWETLFDEEADAPDSVGIGDEWTITDDARYARDCANRTVYGVSNR